jgi:hypothetical protein
MLWVVSYLLVRLLGRVKVRVKTLIVLALLLDIGVGHGWESREELL